MLIPQMMKALSLSAAPAAAAREAGRYRELLACQVKTLSFLTYLLRGFTKDMKVRLATYYSLLSFDY